MALAGRLICLALISAGLGTATLTTLEPASAAVAAAARSAADAPTAIAVAPSGASYVGFASGGRLLRLAPRGHRAGGVPLDRDDPVDGLFVNPAGQIWVDYGTSASLLAPGGRVLRHVSHPVTGSCDASPASRYGGITVGGGRVWVAHRCGGAMSVYSLSGRLLATVDLPGGDHPRGITYGGAQSGRPATVYVALPDSGRIVSYRADRVRSASQPARTVRLARPAGGVRPRPGGIAVDRFGQLTVADLANNAIYLVDTNHDFDRYRVLGHPPRASRQVGRLSSPGAIAQYPQDGGSLSGNLFIADSGNQRVQRWNTSGWTYWVEPVRAARVAGPVGSVAPRIVGTAAVGETLTCSPGSWVGGGLTYTYRWRRDGVVISSSTASTYVVGGRDAGAALTCVVTAANGRAAVDAVSPAVLVPAAHEGPVSTTPPSVTGAGSVGTALTCTPGGWSGGPLAHSYSWTRDGVAIAHTASARYVVLNADVGTALGCTMTATGAAGSASASSARRTVTAPPADAPVNLTTPTVSGSPEDGATLTCDPGAWSGSPTTVLAVWQRDGATVANGSWTYRVGAADSGAALQCVVVAGNGWGLGAARSGPAAADRCDGPAGVEIDGGAAETTSTVVTLTLRAPRGTRTVHLSNDPELTGETVAAYPAGCTYDWVMPAIAGMPLPWSVYVRYDGSGTTYSDSIVVSPPA